MKRRQFTKVEERRRLASLLVEAAGELRKYVYQQWGLPVNQWRLEFLMRRVGRSLERMKKL